MDTNTTKDIYLHERWCVFMNLWIQLLVINVSWIAASTLGKCLLACCFFLHVSFLGEAKHARPTFVNPFQQIFLHFHNHRFLPTFIKPYLRWHSYRNFADASYPFSCSFFFLLHISRQLNLWSVHERTWQYLL